MRYKILDSGQVECYNFTGKYNNDIWLDATAILKANNNEMPLFIKEDLTADDEKIKAHYEQIEYLRIKTDKEAQVQRMITTVASGKTFYTDPISLIDLMRARDRAVSQEATNEALTDWKTPNGITKVTVFDIKEAIDKSLDEKGKIVGAINV